MDGDTIEVLHNKKAKRIRLQGIDCPEKAQAFGQRAKQVTSALMFAKTVIVEAHGHDKYQRTVGTVMLSDGTNVNRELVAQGWCWWYQQYAAKDLVLATLEVTARIARKGCGLILIPYRGGNGESAQSSSSYPDRDTN